jgi:predicted nucleotidyltransferase
MSNLDEIKSKIMLVCAKTGIKVSKIILFGSRARGDFDARSDFDVLLITHEWLDFGSKIQLAKLIRFELAKIFISIDVIVKSVAEVKIAEEHIGSVVRQALKEGILI